MLKAFDADGHVDEWEGTFSDEYLEPAFREQRPVVVDADLQGTYFTWNIPGRGLWRVGSSPSSKGGVNSQENIRLAEWRGTLESGEFRSAAARSELLDVENTEIQVNYPTLFLYHPTTLDIPLNQALTRAYNNWISDISNQEPERYKWVTVVDVHDPKEAAKEIFRTKKMGSVGIMVHGMYGTRTIDDDFFAPLWSAAQEAQLPIAVHPGRASLDVYNANPNYGAAQFHLSVLLGFRHIMASGVLDRYPDVNVGFLETGCSWVDFAVEQVDLIVHDTKFRAELGATRAEHDALIAKGLPKLTPEEYIKSGRVFIGFEVDEEMLPYVIQRWGEDCWLYASDIPHGHRIVNAPQQFELRKDISEVAKRKLLIDNTASFYGLPVPAAQ